jgi:hypothetical protein
MNWEGLGRIGKDWEGSEHGLVEITSFLFPGGTEENQR